MSAIDPTTRSQPAAVTGPELVALSDDVTGAAAVAAELHDAGLRVRLVPAGDVGDAAGRALVADTGTRSAGATEAARVLTRVLRSVDVPRHGWFKRIDTGLRGNVAAELAAFSDTLARPLVVAAAAPTLGVVTVDGTQRAGGAPVTETHYADGPDRPTTSALTELLPDSVLVGLPAVRHPDLERTLARIVGASRHAICDSVTESDLARIGAALAGLGERAVPVGSYGLARHWAAGLGSSAGPVLTAVSSLKPCSLEQVEVAVARGAHLTPAADVAGIAGARRALAAGRDAVLTTVAGGPPAVATRDAAGRMAACVLDLATTVPVAGLILIGGELATSFLRRARAAAEPIAAPWPAAAAVRLTGGPLDGQIAIFRSGARGEPGWIDQAASVIRGIRRLGETAHA